MYGSRLMSNGQAYRLGRTLLVPTVVLMFVLPSATHPVALFVFVPLAVTAFALLWKGSVDE